MYVFVADAHLRPGNREDEACFLGWLDEHGKKAEKIYVLGDLFEYWYAGIEPRVSAIIEKLSEHDVKILPGNRDFLMRASSLPQVVHEEEIIIELYGRKCLVAHGHTLTEHDRGFKLLHRFGWPIIKHLDAYLSAPLKEKIAEKLVRASSVVRPLQAEIRPGICDEKGVDIVICGHLHRGMMNDKLIVLPPFSGKGEWLEYSEDGPVFRRLS